MDAPSSTQVSMSPAKETNMPHLEQMNTAPAHQTAFAIIINTTELFENVLVHLDFKTLLIAKRVNHRFKNVIDNSINLQKKLFLTPLKSFKEAHTLNMLDGEAWVILDRADEHAVGVVNHDLLEFRSNGTMYPFYGGRFELHKRVQAGMFTSQKTHSWENMYLCSENAGLPIKILFSDYDDRAAEDGIDIAQNRWSIEYKLPGILVQHHDGRKGPDRVVAQGQTFNVYMICGFPLRARQLTDSKKWLVEFTLPGHAMRYAYYLEGKGWPEVDGGIDMD